MLKKSAKMTHVSRALAAAFVLMSSAGAQATETKYITIGTAGQTGTYYVVGQSICKMVNRGAKEHGVQCNAPATGGSVANLNALRDGSLEMGIAQSDWQYHAMHGTSRFKDAGPNPDIRSVFAVHGEPFAVVARTDVKASHFDDLGGKRINIGNPGSGQRGTMEALMGMKGWTNSTFKAVSELSSTEHAQALCDNKIDAFVYTSGHPVANLKEAATTCDIKVIPVTGREVDKLVADNPYYSKKVVPGGMYKGVDTDVPTFGVSATFVASAKAHPDVIYQTVKAVFENFDKFKQLHPAFEHLNPKSMISEGLSAPLHEGAVRYYKERGWL